MQTRKHDLTSGYTLVIREATVVDACNVLDYIENISGESEFLTFGPGEFDVNESDEKEFLWKYKESDHQLCMLGLIDDTIVSILNYSSGHRPRIRHCGEFGMSVRKQFWGLGIGSLMLDHLIEWAKETDFIVKINLRVRTDNQRAILLYKRKGFVKEGTIRREIHLNGEYYDHHWMGLEL